MSWEIDKSFSACFGHRVWSQELNTDYTAHNDNLCKCRHLHGHEMLIKVFLKSNELSSGMVTDFKHLGWFKDFIDDVIDHKFMMDINDPLLKYELQALVSPDGSLNKDLCKYHSFGNYYTPDLSKIEFGAPCLTEKYEGMVLVDFVPTSENLCKWLYDLAQEKMNGFADVSAVEYWETPKSHCKYTGE
jgi:6-pyruvoyltetrahydropterin/6-carboxytetrahydropterin synthase